MSQTSLLHASPEANRSVVFTHLIKDHEILQIIAEGILLGLSQSNTTAYSAAMDGSISISARAGVTDLGGFENLIRVPTIHYQGQGQIGPGGLRPLVVDRAYRPALQASASLYLPTVFDILRVVPKGAVGAGLWNMIAMQMRYFHQATPTPRPLLTCQALSVIGKRESTKSCAKSFVSLSSHLYMRNPFTVACVRRSLSSTISK